MSDEAKPQLSHALPGLDVLRGMAILMVMRFHAWDAPLPFAWLARVGWIGVDLFFVLSGFLIGGQLFRELQAEGRVDFRRFYRRRAFRILPLYLVVLGLYFLWPAWREAPGISPLWQFCTFTVNFFIDYQHARAFSHAWSLCIEEQFYLVFPLVAWGLVRRPSGKLSAAVAVSVFVLGMALRVLRFRHLLAAPSEDEMSIRYLQGIYYPTSTRLDGLLWGVVLAAVRVYRPRAWAWLVARGNTLLVLGMALLVPAVFCVLSEVNTMWRSVLSFPSVSLAFAALVAGAASPTSLFGRWRVPGARGLATLAYALYLTHKEVLHFVGAHWPQGVAGGGYAALGVDLLACFAVAGVAHVAVEKPGLRWRTGLPARSAAGTKGAASAP